MLVVVALNAAEVKPAATVTEAGTVSTVLVFVRVTAAPPAGATLLKVTVHMLEAFGPRLGGLQASEDTNTGETRLTLVVVELPFNVAVTMAF
jgi:hypothetical protein